MKKDRFFIKLFKNIDLMIKDLMYEDVYDYAKDLKKMYPNENEIDERIEYIERLLCFDILGKELVKYNGTDTNVVVPDGVTTIGKRCFAFNNTVKSIVLPDSIIEIEYDAFLNCDKLENINLPQSIVKIGCGSFSNCLSLKEIVLPNNVEVLEDYTFEGCRNLVSIELPINLKKIGKRVIYDCTSLEEVKNINIFCENSKIDKSVNIHNYNIDKNKN